MRRTHTCPKCGSRKLFVVKQFERPDVKGPLSLISAPVRDPTDILGYATVEAGPVECWVCPGCGFTELYTHQEGLAALKLISENPRSEVQLIDFDAPAGPYR